MLRDAVQRELAAEARNIDLAQTRRLAEEAAECVDRHMGLTPSYADKFDLLSAALKEVDPSLDGLYCEFGVFEGRTLNFIASQTQSPVHGFDSFEGLPEDWRTGVMRGAFKTGKLPAVRDNVRLHPGWFSETVPEFARAHPAPLAFVHIDADLYSSTKTIFDVLGPQIVAGTVIQFDEFFNYPGWQQGEYRAFAEFCAARQLQVRYIGYTHANSPAQVAVKVTHVKDHVIRAATPLLREEHFTIRDDLAGKSSGGVTSLEM